MDEHPFEIYQEPTRTLQQLKSMPDSAPAKFYTRGLCATPVIYELSATPEIVPPSTVNSRQSRGKPNSIYLPTLCIPRILHDDVEGSSDEEYNSDTSNIPSASASQGSTDASSEDEVKSTNYMATLLSTLSRVKSAVEEVENYVGLAHDDFEPIQHAVKVILDGLQRLDDMEGSKARYPDFLHPFLPPPEHVASGYEDTPGIVRCRVGFPNPKRLRPGYDNMEERLCNKHFREAEFMMSMKIYSGKEERTHAWKCA